MQTQILLEYQAIKNGKKQTANIRDQQYGIYYEASGCLPAKIMIHMLKQGFERLVGDKGMREIVIFRDVLDNTTDIEYSTNKFFLPLKAKKQSKLNLVNNKVVVLLNKQSLIWEMNL